MSDHPWKRGGPPVEAYEESKRCDMIYLALQRLIGCSSRASLAMQEVLNTPIGSRDMGHRSAAARHYAAELEECIKGIEASVLSQEEKQ